MENPCDGIILIDKPEGETSFGVVKKIRELLNIKKAGHAGTLDPFATGLLIILLGQGTKLFPYIMSREKKYHTVVTLGVETDTMDPTGRIVRTVPVPELRMGTIKDKSQGFMGEIEQVPPMYSAVKHKGKKAYELARKGIKIALKKRRVRVFHLEITSLQLPDVTMEVSCSSGTYIRSLAADLGEKLGTCAHVKALRRMSIGPFEINHALDFHKSTRPGQVNLLRDHIIPLREALPHLREAQVSDQMAREIRNGYPPKWGDLTADAVLTGDPEDPMKIVNKGELVGIIRAETPLTDKKEAIKIMRVFH